MNTGNFENFAGTIVDIGPMYPFVGTEVALVVVAVIFWLWWHISELRIEKREYDAELEKLSDAASIERHLDKRTD